MTGIDLRVEEGRVEGLDGFERLQALQEPFYAEWKKRGSTEQAGLELLGEATPGQRTLLTTWWVDGEVANGGLVAVFYNSTGSYLPEIVEGLEALGARGRVDLLKRAAAALFPEGVSRSMEERNELLEDLPEDEAALDQELEQLDEAWYEQNDNLEQLLLELVQRRPEEFIR